MKTLDLAAVKFRQAEGLDKINDLAERRLNHDLARSGGGKAHHRGLPQLMVAALGHGNIELISDSGLNAFQNAAFALE